MNKQFNSLTQLQKYFNNKQRCVEHLEQLRWGNDGRACVYCSSTKVYVCKGFGKYKCGDCNCRFTVTTGTYFENTKIPLTKWFIALYLCLSRKKGTSSCQLARDIDVTQKTAWFILHRIRAIISETAPEMLLSGMVEADETWIGGKEKNKHANKKKRLPGQFGGNRGYASNLDKDAVAGVIERNGKVRAKHILTVNRTTLTPFIKQNVAPGTRVITDEHHGYADLNKNNYQHDFVKHTEKIYVIGDVHTNTIENFWSVVKRCIHGTYHQLSAKHLQVYINEISFRFNTRNETEEARFDQALNKCHGRLKYNNLIGKVENK